MAGKSFGKDDQLTFELYRNGAFVIDGEVRIRLAKVSELPGFRPLYARQSPCRKLTRSVLLSGVSIMGLENIAGLPQDPEYTEGPHKRERLLPHRDHGHAAHWPPHQPWWHQHRKVAIDVDNNVWGHGMPNPVFMVYFDRDNKLVSYNGKENEWQNAWVKGVTYKLNQWYRVEIEKTKRNTS